jgi:hypothetical protein
MITYNDFKHVPIPRVCRNCKLNFCIKIITGAMIVKDDECPINYEPFENAIINLNRILNKENKVVSIVKFNNSISTKRWFLIDEITIEEKIFVYTDINEMIKSIKYHENEFDTIQLYEDNSGVNLAYIALEKWAQCGGPQPYSDSYTFAIYLDENNFNVFKNLGQSLVNYDS